MKRWLPVAPSVLFLACSAGGGDPAYMNPVNTAGATTGGAGPMGAGAGGMPLQVAGAAGMPTAGSGGVAPGGSGGAGGIGDGGAPMMGDAGMGGTLGMAGSDMGGSGGAGVPADPGRTLYESNCLACHGAEANGAPLLGPGIRFPVRDHATWIVRNGRETTDYTLPMEPFDMTMLTDADLGLIFDYLDSFPKPVTGEGLYQEYCLNCHGADALGGPTQRSLIEHRTFNDVMENTRGGHHPGEFDNRMEYMPAFTAAELSDAELQLIADYLLTL